MTRKEIFVQLEKHFDILNPNEREMATRLLKMLALKETNQSPPQNPSLEEWVRLTPIERGERLLNEEQHHQAWLTQKFHELHAGWVVVMDGQVIRFGVSFSDAPTDDELYTEATKLGKYPLLFFNDTLFAIEETSSTWNTTIYKGDFYPTLSIRLDNQAASLTLDADFDTGAFLDVCTGWNLLESQGLVTPMPEDVLRFASHLNQSYSYLRRRLSVGLIAEDGTRRQAPRIVICVQNWQYSPFVSINTTRIALVGRGLCLNLSPKISLDFANHLSHLKW